MGGPKSREQIVCRNCGVWFTAHRLNPTTYKGRGKGLGDFCSGLCDKQYKKLDRWEVLVNVAKHRFIATNSGVQELL